MSKLIKINYFVDSFVEYKNAGFELIPANNAETFDADGNPVRVFYKRSKFPTVEITIENVTKTLAELNNQWKIHLIHLNYDMTLWGIGRELNESTLYVSAEVYSTESAKYFLELCDKFIKDIFHMKE